MEKQDDHFVEFAKEIEADIIKLCNLRQMDTSITKEAFQEQYLVNIEQREHIENKYNLDIRTKIYEYMMKHSYWKRRLDGIAFMDVFDECIRKYKPQGKFFLSLFINQYSLRTQDQKSYLAENKKMTSEDYIDSRDSVFKNAEQLEINTDDDGDDTYKVSQVDKKDFKEYKENDAVKNNDIMLTLYKIAYNKISEKDLSYLRCFFMINGLCEDLPADELDDEYLDKKLYIEQQALTDHYLAEYRNAKSESSKNIQQKAFLKAKYTEAIVKKYGLKPDTIRKKFKSIQNVLTEIGAQFKLNK
ncbi:hypothetical protein [Anaerovibrio lipolyticus]|uniref:hypothetical protein n=1 Tax=Anaerovibrio lipolyticus TaxID=82374 RepID=UPI0026ED871F|nr:hypothetical protein [Anaerovibrio lipolyticus]MBE6105331.1 hypothetical protein [Anaerovibrio lipolyticus]